MTSEIAHFAYSQNLHPPLQTNPVFSWRQGSPPRQGVIVTDLDGTFLDRTTYSPAASLPALRKALAQRQIVVFCSSKTPSEQIYLQKTLGVRVPFICENGGAIYLPAKDFLFLEDQLAKRGEWLVYESDLKFPRIQLVLQDFEETYGIDLGCMSETPLSKLSEMTGLSEPAALRARTRLYSETLTASLDRETKNQLGSYLLERGLKFECGGRFHTVTSVKTDKGKAFIQLKAILQSTLGNVVSIGLGDSENDLPLLETVDFPVLVAKPDGKHEPLQLDTIHRNKKPGPHGWADTIENWLAIMGDKKKRPPERAF